MTSKNNSISSSKFLEWLAFLVIGVACFGSSFYWIKVALQELVPMHLMSFRCIISATLLWFIVLLFKLKLPRNKHSIITCMFCGIMGGALPNTLVSWAEQYMESSIIGVLVSTTPLFTALIGPLILKTQKSFKNNMFYIIIGFTGILLIASSRNTNIAQKLTLDTAIALPILCALSASLLYSLFGIFAKLYLSGAGHPISLAAISTTASALIITSIGAYTNGMLVMPKSANTWIAVVWIAVITSALSQVLIYFLINTWGATKISTISYLIPLIALFLGVVLLKEKLTFISIIGCTCIIFSIYMTDNQKKNKVVK